MTNLDFKGSYHRHLPHIQPPGATFFITTRLAGSLPSSVMERLARETAEIQAKYADDPELADIEGERYWFRHYETALHESKNGPFWLREDRVAAVLAEGIHFNDQKLYRLDAFCIMPNHLHIVFMPLPTTPVRQGAILSHDAEGNIGYLEPADDGQRQFVKLKYFSLARIMHRLKRRSAREGNKLLARVGDFWEHESYDHWIRDDEEWGRTIAYVCNNPVAAGLVKDWSEWRWTYVREPER
jgi:REP element-mobilizing transposase RayT